SLLLTLRRAIRRMEVVMSRMVHLSLPGSLIALLNITPSWAQVCSPPGCNPTTSDGNLNTAGGTGALANVDETISGGVHNTAFGSQARVSCTIGAANTATGASALSSDTTGKLNTASGFQALQLNTDGNNNTAIGAKALKKSTGTKNIGIGYQAGMSLVNGNNNIYIGNQGAGDEFQTIRLGTAQTSTFIAGIAGTPIVSNAATVAI